MGSKSQTQTSTSSTTPTNLAGLQSIFNQVQGAASTPYQAYNGELTAGINGQQTQGINNINANAGYANPFIQQASGLVQNAANPLTASQIQNYQNPYTQQVVDATQAQFAKSNAEGQNSLKGNAAIAGALGGDRQAVAQAQLAGQQATAQAPVIANLYSQGYNNAVNTAQQQYQQNPLAQANALANYGVQGQNAALTGANAQINAGTLQQGTQQNQDTAAYQQYLQKQGYPFQTAQFLAQYGIPAATAQGSSSTGTQTTPGPNTAAQVAGLGISAAGLFLKDGGSVNGYSAGGTSPFNFIEDVKGYVPVSQGIPSAQLPTSQLQFAKPSAEQQNPFASTISGLNKMQGTFAGEQYGGGNIFTDASGGSSSSPLEGLDASDYGAGFKVGGLVEAIHHIRHGIKRARGGTVGPSPFASYADGGTTFDDRFSAAFDPIPRQADGDIVNPGDPIRMPSREAVQAWRDDTSNPALVADSGLKSPAAPVSSPSPMQAALPKQISNPDSVPEEEPSQAMAFDRSPMAISPPGAPAAPAQGQFGHSLFGANLSDKTRQSLVAAGLGMLASKSPFFGTALGEGGLKGLGAYSDLTKQEQEVANQAATKAQNQQRIDMEAKRLSQSAEQFTKNYGLKKQELEQGYQPKYGVVGQEIDPDTGTPHNVYGWIDPNTKQITRDPNAPSAKAAPLLNDKGELVTGDEYLKSLSPQRAEIARKIGNYEINPSGLSIKGGRREQAIADAARYNPGYDQRNFNSSNAAIKNFNAGPESRTVRSLNVAIDHLGTLDEAAKALQNGDYPTLNKIVNLVKEKTGSPVTTNFDSIKQVVSAEIAKAVVGGQTALHDRDDMAKRAANSQSPQQISGIITEFKKLMAGQMNGLRHSYEASTGLKDFDKYMEPQTKKELEAFSQKGDDGKSHSKYEETKEIGGKKYGRVGKDWFAL